jgi:hypothetical protein
LPRFTNGNPKYPEGFGGLSGFSGLDLPPLGSNGCLAKSYPFLWAFLYAYPQGLFPFESMVLTSY